MSRAIEHTGTKDRRFGALLTSVFIPLLFAGVLATAQTATVRTFLVYYRHYSFQENDGAKGYTLFVNGPMSARDRHALWTENPSTIFLSYLNMISVEEGVTPWADDVIKNHSEALLKTIGGTRDSTLPLRRKYAWGYLTPYDSTKHTKNYFLTNPASEEWRRYYIGLARKQLQSDPPIGRHGLFVDNVWPFYWMFFAGVPKDLQVDMNGDGVMTRDDDWAWAEAIAGFSRGVRKALGDSIVLLANFGTRWDNKGTAYLILTRGSFDGAMNESFAHNSLSSDSSSYPSVQLWKQDVNALMIADSLGKIALAQSLGKENDDRARLFCLGSFLLGMGSESYYNYRFRGYDTLYRLPEFDLDIGGPLRVFRDVSQAMIDSAGVYGRKYSRGTVYVNMGQAESVIPLGRREQVLHLVGGTSLSGGRMEWSSASMVLLRPKSAAIVRVVSP